MIAQPWNTHLSNFYCCWPPALRLLLRFGFGGGEQRDIGRQSNVTPSHPAIVWVRGNRPHRLAVTAGDGAAAGLRSLPCVDSPPLDQAPAKCPLLGVKRTCLFALHMSAYDPKRTFAKIGLRLRTFGVRYHETFDFFRIKGALRCKANNFLATTSINGSSGSFSFKTLRIRSNAVVISFIVSGPNVVPGIYFLIGIKPPAEIYASNPLCGIYA
jgi:hypothetical protein